MLTSWLTLALIIINFNKIKSINNFLGKHQKDIHASEKSDCYLKLSIECSIFKISFHREIFWNIFRDCSVCFDWVKVLVIKVDTHQNSCPLFIFVNEAGSSGNSIFSLSQTNLTADLKISLWVTKSGENQNTTMIVLF